MSRIPLFAPSHSPALSEALLEAFTRVERSGRYVLGEELERFEEAFARYLGVRWVVGVSSGSDALLAALLALGIGPGDEVVTTPLSFIATAEAIARVGATAVFADVREDTLCLDAEAVEAALTPRIRAIVPVHLYGAAAPMAELSALSERHGVPIIEDAAQAAGGVFDDGRKLGSLGAMSAFSFFPSKPLGGLGDGGAIATNDERLASACRSLRVHGRVLDSEGSGRRGTFGRLGGNFRLDALQAALLAEKLPELDAWRDARARIARAYDRGFTALASRGVAPASSACAGHASAGSLRVESKARSAHGAYTLRLRGASSEVRDGVARELASAGVETAVYYRRLLRDEPSMEGHHRVAAGGTPVAQRACEEVLSLTIFPGLSEAQIREVVERVCAAVDRSSH